MPYEHIALRAEGGLAWLTIQRPKALNALNEALLAELDAALDALAADETVGVLAITGAGDKAFVAGADIAGIAKLRGLGGRDFARRGQALFDKVENFPVPVIAAVNGYALGGGCELAIACHLRVASEKAVFGLPEVTLGIIPGYGGTQRLPRLLGKGRALDLILTGRMVKAEEALSLGLANRVVPEDELEAAVTKLAGTLTERGPLALRAALEAVRGGLESSQAEGLRLEAQLFGLLCNSEDMQEGTQAFLEKRKAEFKGR
jgi:enoyl-CoA hydratase